MSEPRLAFVASASDPSLGINEAEGSITVDSWHLRFVSPALVLEIPLAKLAIELDESVEGRVCFSDPENAQCVVTTFDSRILDEGALQRQTHTRNQIRAIRGRDDLQRRLKITAWCLAFFLLATALAPFLLGMMVRSIVARIPTQWESAVGDTVLQELKQRERFIEDDRLNRRLLEAVAPLTNALPADQQFSFYLLDNPLPNAFALPGGHVMVNAGLLDLTDRPAEVAAVVAHEIAHVRLRHGFRKIVASAGPYLIARLFVRDNGGLLGALGNSSQLLVRQSFSQEYELEADAAGWDYLVKARIDPRAMANMLLRLRGVQEHYQPGGSALGAFSSHPATEKRIRRLEAKWRKFDQKAAFDPASAPGR